MSSRLAPDIKRRLKNGEIVYSAWLTFQSPAVAEIIAGTGFEVVLIDMEHTSMSLETLEAAIGSMSRWDPVNIVRVPGHDPSLIKRILDIGADGIIAPNVRDGVEAKAIVDSVKYPPIGKRGYGPRRASDYFRNPGYFEEANDCTFAIVQIEDPEAADRADEIAATVGLDVLCHGPADMAVRCGLLHDPADPEVEGAIEKVFAAARRHGVPVCMGRYETAEDQVELVRRGARLVIASDDLVVLRTGMERHLRDARTSLEKAAAGAKAPDRAY